MDSYTIRNGKKEDIPGLVRLLSKLFAIEKDFSVDYAKQERGLELLLRNAETCGVFVAERSGVILGMATIQKLISTAEGAWVGLIEDVVVDEHCRGIGIGRSLMRYVELWARARSLTRLQLLADKNNQAALLFYDREEWRATDLICLRKKNF